MLTFLPSILVFEAASITLTIKWEPHAVHALLKKKRKNRRRRRKRTGRGITCNALYKLEANSYHMLYDGS